MKLWNIIYNRKKVAFSGAFKNFSAAIIYAVINLWPKAYKRNTHNKRSFVNRTKSSKMDVVSVALATMLAIVSALDWKANAATNVCWNWLMWIGDNRWKRTSWPVRDHRTFNRITKSQFTCPNQKKVFRMAEKSVFCRQKLNRSKALNQDWWNSPKIHCKYIAMSLTNWTKLKKLMHGFFPNSYLEPGYDYSAVVSGKETGVPMSATLHWDYRTDYLNPLTWRVKSPRIYIKYIEVESLEHSSK